MRSIAPIVASACVLLSGVLPASAETKSFAVLRNGMVMRVTSVAHEQGKVKLTLVGGGELIVPESILDRIDTEGSSVTSAPAQGATTQARIPGNARGDIPTHPWKEQMLSAASRNALDARLVYAIANVESAMNPRARSPKGALGLMQLMPGTARDLGVKDPLDPVQSIDGGCRYLRQLLDQFGGDVRKAVAAYNAGPTTVAEIGTVPAYPETRDYVERVMTAYSRL